MKEDEKLQDGQVCSREELPQTKSLSQKGKTSIITDSYQVFSGSTKSIRGEVPDVSPPECVQDYDGGEDEDEDGDEDGGEGGGEGGGGQPAQVQIPGAPHPTIPLVVWGERPGDVIAAPGYKWKYPDIPGNLEVILLPELAGLKEVFTWSSWEHDEKPMKWTEGQKETVLAALGGFEDSSKVRGWLINVKFELRREGTIPQTSPWAGASKLIFTNYFFSPDITYAKRENLIAFEAGKVFLGMYKSLEKWFDGYQKRNSKLIWDMKKATYLKEDMSFIHDLPDQRDNGFGYAFRAYALGLQLDSSEGQEAQQEFKKRIDSLLQGNQ